MAGRPENVNGAFPFLNGPCSDLNWPFSLLKTPWKTAHLEKGRSEVLEMQTQGTYISRRHSPCDAISFFFVCFFWGAKQENSNSSPGDRITRIGPIGSLISETPGDTQNPADPRGNFEDRAFRRVVPLG